MVNPELDKLPQIGRYRTAWEVCDLREVCDNLYQLYPVAYYKDPQTALLRACAEGYSVRMVFLEETDNIRIAD